MLAAKFNLLFIYVI